MSVVQLSEAKSVPDEELIEMLEDLLADARTGEVRSCAFAAVLKDGASRTGWSKDANIFTQLGVIENLKMRFHQRTIEVLT